MPGGRLLPDDLSIGQAVEHYPAALFFRASAVSCRQPALYQRVLAEVEYPLVLAAMTATRGNQIKAADLLGLNRNTLRKKIRELGVNVYRAVEGWLSTSRKCPRFRHKPAQKRCCGGTNQRKPA